MKHDPANQRIQNNLGVALYKLGKYDQALEAYRKGTDEASAYNNMGYLQMSEGKLDEAVSSFEKAVALKPSYYVRAHENMQRVKSSAESRGRP